jgi:alkylation response protein AidB-like acyl-CoA dehydrogenase
VLAWGPGPQAKAVAVDGGYRVTGKWAFASGGRHATWIGAQAPIFEADGRPRLDEQGQQVYRTLLVRAGESEWTDIWSVVGLSGTASDQFALTDHFVRHDHSITRDFLKECREPGALYACRHWPATSWDSPAWHSALRVHRSTCSSILRATRCRAA